MKELGARGASTRSFMVLLMGACIAGVVLGLLYESGAKAQATDDRPNILFIMADDLNKAQAKPSIWDDTFARIKNRGVTYPNFYIPNPLCCPARALIMSGRFSHNQNIWDNDLPRGGYVKMKNTGLLNNTIATRMQAAGYRTAHVGKFTNQYDRDDAANCTDIPSGYAFWFAKCDDGGSGSGVYSDQGQFWRPDNYDAFNEEAKFRAEANSFIQASEADDAQPFYMQYWIRAPHTGADRGSYAGTEMDQPLPEPPSFNEPNVDDKPSWIRDNKKFCKGTTATAECGKDTFGDLQGDYRTRLESSKNADDQIGLVLDKLRDTGELGDTIIVFTSDNGYLLGQHRHWKKRVPYEESTNVPLYVRGPGVPAGATRSHVVMGVDFMATFVQGVAGGTAPANHDGRDFSKTWLAGGDPDYVSDVAWPRTYAFVEAADLVGDPPEYRGIFNINTNSTYYRYPQTTENEFYDLDEDPGQLNNSALQNRGQVDNLRTAATRMANCSADTCRQYDH